MYNSQFHISSLIAGHVRGELTAARQRELQEWIELSEANRQLFLALTNEETLQSKLSNYSKGNTASVWNKTMLLVNAQAPAPKRLKIWPRIAVAAAAVTAIVLSIWIYTSRHPDTSRYPELVSGSQDIPPGKNTAILNFNGRTVQLSEAKTGVKFDDDKLTYSDGSALSPKGEAFPDGERMVTATTPRGGTYEFVLQDGTRVWLNADSKLEFYSSYKNKSQRIVKLEGEAYFEVAKIYSRGAGDRTDRVPFIVESAGQQVEVLGTHFNVSAYADDPEAATTLLEGSVQVTPTGKSGQNALVLKPGQQARLAGKRLKVVEVDTELATAWKNGEFIFNDETLGSIMKKVERWYDVQVEYKDINISKKQFAGTITRFAEVSDLLKMLSLTGDVHFKIEGRRIVVTK